VRRLKLSLTGDSDGYAFSAAEERRILDKPPPQLLHEVFQSTTVAAKGLVGVCWKNDNQLKPWQVRAQIDGKYHFVGRFATQEEGAREYDAAVFPHFGECAPASLSPNPLSIQSAPSCTP